MPHDRDDRRPGGDRYGREPRGYDHGDRGFMERAGDEVRSWFGDEDAERRRQADDRHGRPDEGRAYQRDREHAYRGDRGPGQPDAPAGRSAYDRDPNVGYGGAFGADRSFGADYAERHRGRHDHDPAYRSWRDRQMASLDRDYEEYRREHQSRFDSEFHSWRQGRQGQRDLLARVQEHWEVVGSDGQHVGTVDHVKDDQLELTKTDRDADGRHHLVPSSWIATVDDGRVVLARTADEAKRHWRDEARDAAGQRRGDPDRGFRGY